MSDAKDLVRRLRQVASELKNAAKWHGSGLAVDATKNDFLYELDCYFRAALAANRNFEIRVSGTTTKTTRRKPAAKWPKKPGNKKNFSYLSLINPKRSNEIYQLCPGIKILDKDGKARAPDINLLSSGAPDDPNHSHVFAIWDAKFTSRMGEKLPDTAVSDFVFNYLQLGRPTMPDDWLKKVKNIEWRRSGLITNALFSTEPDAALDSYGVSETSEFPDGPPKTRP